MLDTRDLSVRSVHSYALPAKLDLPVNYSARCAETGTQNEYSNGYGLEQTWSEQ